MYKAQVLYGCRISVLLQNIQNICKIRNEKGDINKYILIDYKILTLSEAEQSKKLGINKKGVKMDGGLVKMNPLWL